MAILQGHKLILRIGRQTDRTTVCPFSAPDYESSSAANRWFDLAIDVDGFQALGDNPTIQVPTQHGVRGNAYSIGGDRNTQQGSLSMPFFPECAAFLLGLPAVVSDQKEYYTIEEYHDSGIGSGTGAQYIGCVFDGFSMTLNRGTTGVVSISLPFFFNQDKELTASAPSFTRPATDPYSTRGLMIDLVKTTSSFDTDLTDVESADISVSDGVTVSDHRGSNTDSLDGTWTTHSLATTPTVGVQSTLVVRDSEYLNWHRGSPKPDFMLRVGMGYQNPTYKEDLTGVTLTDSTSTQTVTGVDVSGLAVGDQVLITDGSKFTVSNVSAVDAGLDTFDVDGSDCAFSSAAVTVSNAAVELRILRMDLSSPGAKTVGGGRATVSHGFSAELVAGETTLYTYKAANDDNT